MRRACELASAQARHCGAEQNCDKTYNELELSIHISSKHERSVRNRFNHTFSHHKSTQDNHY
jgi:hypothetical protein